MMSNPVPQECNLLYNNVNSSIRRRLPCKNGSTDVRHPVILVSLSGRLDATFTVRERSIFLAYDNPTTIKMGLQMPAPSRRIYRGIGWRLLISILLVSSVVTLALTVAQLYFEYRRDVGEIEQRLAELRSSYADSLAGGLWQFDTEQIKLQLGGIQRLPDIQALELRETNSDGRQPLVIRSGTPLDNPPIVREIPLIFTDHNGPHAIGTLRIEATFEHVYARLLGSALLILFNQGIKTFIVSLFILLTVYRLVTRHLIDLAQSVDSFDLRNTAPRLALDRPISDEPDELDRMVQAIQSMQDSLRKAYKDLKSSNLDMETEISQRRETEAKLQDLVEKLTISNSELQRFAYVASHDLQEPLRGIALYAQKLEKDYRGRFDSNADEYLDYIIGNARQMYKLVNDLLTFSRLGRGLTFTTVQLDAACRTAIDKLSILVKKSGANVRMTALPEIEGNPALLAELFENLIDNAIKFSRPGVALEVWIDCKLHEGQPVISVADNGIGIEASNQDIFDIFRRHHTKQAYPGTGIGLAICKRIVQIHHGRIWYESKPGEGTTFFFTLGQEASQQHPEKG